MKIALTTNLMNNPEALQGLYNMAEFAKQNLLCTPSIFLPADLATDHVRTEFTSNFNFATYTSIEELETLISKDSCSLLYALKSGNNDSIVSKNVPTLVHCLETAEDPHGSVYAAVSSEVPQASTTRFPSIALPVPKTFVTENIRPKLGIPKDATVFGVFGGNWSIDAQGVKETLIEVLNSNPNIYFIVFGGETFTTHPRVKHLGHIFEPELRARIVETCDALVQGRKAGETFGLFMAEFSSKHKQVISLREAPRTHHVVALGSFAHYYSNPEELKRILLSFKKDSPGNWSGFKNLVEPDSVKEVFTHFFLSPLGWDPLHGIELSEFHESLIPSSDKEKRIQQKLPHSELINLLVKPSQRWIEIGSGCGIITIEISKKVGASGSVISIEPQSVYLCIQHANLKSHGIKNVHTIRAAVADKRGYSYLSPPEDRMEAYVMGASGTGEGTDLIRIDDFEWDTQVDGIFVDAEGAENFFLEGARQTILRDRPLMVMNLNDEKLQRYGTHRRRVFDVIAEHFYEVCFIDQKNSETILAFPREKTSYFEQSGNIQPVTDSGSARWIFDCKVPFKEIKTEEKEIIMTTTLNSEQNNTKFYMISSDDLNKINLKQYDHLIDEYTKEWFHLEAGKEHYRLLAHLSTLFPHRTIVDVGTNRGGSAIALSHDERTQVVTFDIVNNRTIPIQKKNVEFRLKDCREDLNTLMSAPLIFLDTFHDGTFEREFYQFLLEHGYKGMLLLDDIFLNDEMKSFWNDIKIPKADLTAVGHWSGTGIVYF